MKKLILAIVGSLTISGAAFGQGWINYSTSFSFFTAQTNSTLYSPLFGGGSANGGAIGSTAGAQSGLIYDYVLLYQSQAGYQQVATDSHVWDGTWFATAALGGGSFTATNSNTAGRINTVQTSGNQQVSWANGTTNNIVFAGWSANLGNSWVTVSNILEQLSLGNNAPLLAATGGANAYFGISSFGYINPSLNTPGASIVGSSASANGLPISSLNTQLYLLPVPEPTTIALAGLGGLSLLLFRRRKV